MTGSGGATHTLVPRVGGLLKLLGELRGLVTRVVRIGMAVFVSGHVMSSFWTPYPEHISRHLRVEAPPLASLVRQCKQS